jgi:Protein of unknown function (DUF2723)
MAPMAAGAFAFLVALAVYVATRAPDLTFIDSGELAAAATLLGIPHPTGYPLYTLVGRTLTTLPGPLDPLARLTLFSAVAGALAAGLAADAARRLLKAAGVRGTAQTAGAVAAGLALAMGATAWKQAVIVEVYALHLFLLTLLLDLALLAADPTGPRPRRERALIVFAYLGGLALGNHLSAILLLPALAFLVWREHQGAILHRRALMLCAGAFLASASIYLYLPIRSALEPALDWGDPDSPGRFYRHATGAVYRVWFLSSAAVAAKQFGRFLAMVPLEMSPLALAPAAFGVALLWRKRTALAQATILLLLMNLLYAVNYDIHDIDAYFLPAFLVLALWVGAGIGFAAEWGTRRVGAARRPAAAWTVAMALAALIPSLAFAWNLRSASQRENHLVPDYAAAMFGSLGENAVLLSRQWDHFCSAAIYEQQVRGKRTDVTVLEKELLRRSWYLKQLAREDSVLASGCTSDFERFARGLVPFETGGKFDSAALQGDYVALINCLLATATAAGRPVYLTPDALEPGIAGDLVQVPVGLAMQLFPEPPASPPRLPDGADARVAPVRGLAAALASEEPLRAQLAGLVLEMAIRRSIYLAQRGDRAGAAALCDSTLAAAPAHAPARRLKELLASGQTGEPIIAPGVMQAPPAQETPASGPASR